MLARSAKWLGIYLLGVVLIGGWSLYHVLGGTVTHENAPGVIVFPLAWLFGFWPTLTPLLLAHRIWRLQSTLEQIGQQRALGLSSAEPEGELEDTLTLLVSRENGLPQRWVRPFVRRALRS